MKKLFLMICMASVLSLFPYSEEKAAQDLKFFEEQVSKLKTLYEQNEKEYNEWLNEFNQKCHESQQKINELVKEREALIEKRALNRLYANIGVGLICVGIASIVVGLWGGGVDTGIRVPTTPFAVLPVAVPLVAPTINQAKLAAPAA